jgi:hypothetical protein
MLRTSIVMMSVPGLPDPTLGNFGGILALDVGIFYGHLAYLRPFWYTYVFYGHFVYFVVIWYILWPFGIFYGHLVYFMVIWNILWPFGTFSPFGYVVERKKRKISQPWSVQPL